MNEIPPVEGITFVLVCVSGLASAAYFTFYLFRPWHSTPQGRALMTKAVGNVVLLTMAVLYAFLGDYPAREWVRLIGFSIFTTGIVYLLVTLLWSPGARKYPPWTWLPKRPDDPHLPRHKGSEV